MFSEISTRVSAFESWFGPYPFYEDSYKLVEVPYLGMEHQSSVTYGNNYQNGHNGHDISGTGWGLKFDYIIIHESGHEWFANNITYKDIADMWIHESFTTYSEVLFIEYYYGKDAANEYARGIRKMIANKEPIIGHYDVNREGSGDMYPKGANMIHTIRQVINDDAKFKAILRGMNKTFYHQTVTTKQIEDYISKESFFKKKQIGLILAFILVFRLGESQLLKMLSPFLLDPKKLGGMALDTEAVGIIYGTCGVAALTIGGILGGIAISRHGLTKWMFPMFLTMHLPIIGFILLAFFHPASIYYIYAVVILEQFGYGFGFTAFMMYLIHVAEGESKTAHYALATGFMALGMMLPGMLSGYIQKYLGYDNFFIWVLIATIPGLILSRFLTFPKDFGKKSEEV